jgi:hypothetical protein
MADLPEPQAFATIEDLTNFWKAPDDANRANFLLSLASNRIRLIGDDIGVDVDAKAQASAAYKSTLQWVVMESVKRALLTPTDAAPANSIQQTAGPYSENIVFTNPSGDLWFKKSELNALSLWGKQRLGSVATTAADIYSDYEIGS